MTWRLMWRTQNLWEASVESSYDRTRHISSPDWVVCLFFFLEGKLFFKEGFVPCGILGYNCICHCMCVRRHEVKRAPTTKPHLWKFYYSLILIVMQFASFFTLHGQIFFFFGFTKVNVVRFGLFSVFNCFTTKYWVLIKILF